MPPQKFLGRPSRWLWAIHRHGGTLSAGPNFAYEIAAAKIPDGELEGLDLSSWRIAFNGAEPVRAATLEKFTRRFTRYGFDARAMMPVYGLAESAVGGGHNIHPYDLEEAVGALPGIRKGCVAVFGATDRATGSERVVVVAETRVKDAAAVHESLKKKIHDLALAHLGVPADDIVLVGLRVVLKTSSGKIRRAAIRDLYERGMLGAGKRPVALQLARLALGAALGWLRGPRRRLAGWLFAAYAWSLFGVLSFFGGAVLLLLPRHLAPRWARRVARAMVALCGVPLRVEGDERLADALPAVVVANHASYADSIVLAALLPADLKFVAKRELAAYPAGPFLSRIGVRFVERFRTQRAVEDARELAEGVRGGESQMLFPEGRFWRAPGLRQFHMSAFAAAAQSGRPVLPVALRGTRSVLRSGSWLPRRHPVEVFVGAPLWPQGEGWAEAVRLRDEARKAIPPALRRARAVRGLIGNHSCGS